MGPFETFMIRALLSGLFAFFICKFFFGKVAVMRVTGFAILMLGLSYGLEYLRKRNHGGSHEP